MRKKSTGLLALLAATGLTLSACGGANSPVPSPVAATGERVATTNEHFATVQEQILVSILAADKELNADMLAERASGPLLQIRGAQYNAKNIIGSSYTFSTLSTQVTSTAITSAAFPRKAISVVAPLQVGNLQSIYVFDQPSARENWHLWGVLSLLPGATLPAISSGEAGAQLIANDSSEGLVTSPDEAIAGYVNLNQTREDALGLTFESDPVREAIAEVQDGNAKAVEGVGEASMTFGMGESGPVAFRTDDGGAVVFAQMNYTAVISVGANYNVTIKTNQGKIAAGSADAETVLNGQSMTTRSSLLVAIHIPAADAEDKTLRIIGASETGILGVSVE